MNLTHSYKEYFMMLRRICVHDPHIILKYDVCPMLRHYIKLLDDITFKDGSYHTYYGDIKTIITSYTKHWTDELDEAIKEADKCRHSINKDKLSTMIEKTIELHKLKQFHFDEAFSECTDPTEREQYNELNDKYVDCMNHLHLIKEHIKKLDEQEKIDAFAKIHFTGTLKRRNKIFAFTCDFISMKLALVVDRIKISIEEIIARLQNNVRSFQEQLETSVGDLLMKLYEKNKENIYLSRQDTQSPSISKEIAEVNRGMNILIDKIENSKPINLQRLDDEIKYWKKLLLEFEMIANTIKKLEQEENNLQSEKKLFASTKALEGLKYKQKSLEETCGKFKQKWEHIRKLKLKAAKALLTFFSVRGDGRIYYTDDIGTYFMDNYGHQIYVFNYGLSMYHVNCQGEFLYNIPKVINRYYYDENGRYTIENDTKLFKILPCSSQYEIQNGVYIKHTKDCGHSEKVNEKCRMQVKDPNDGILLPDTVPIDIKGTLEPDVIKYLWDTFGHILPDALNDVVRLKPKNPIHCLAHKLLYHKYKRSNNEEKMKRKEAAEYCQKIYQDEIERAYVQYESWRAKQGHVRPEQDDHRAVHAHHEEEQFIRDLNYYN